MAAVMTTLMLLPVLGLGLSSQKHTEGMPAASCAPTFLQTSVISHEQQLSFNETETQESGNKSIVAGCSAFYEACGVDLGDRVNMTCREKREGFAIACMNGGHSPDACKALKLELFNWSSEVTDPTNGHCDGLETSESFCEAVGDLLGAHVASKANEAWVANRSHHHEQHYSQQSSRDRALSERNADVAHYLADLDVTTVPTLLKAVMGSVSLATSLLQKTNSRAATVAAVMTVAVSAQSCGSGGSSSSSSSSGGNSASSNMHSSFTGGFR